MVKRTVTETICEYDKQGNIIKKTVTETHEEEDNTMLTYPSNPLNPCPNTTPRDWYTTPGDWWSQPYVWTATTTDPSTINTTTTTTATN